MHKKLFQMCFFAAKRKGFPVLRNQSKCTVSETVVRGPWISLVLKTAGSAILKGFQHPPANDVSKQPRDYSIFLCSVSSVFVFYPKKYLSLSASSIPSSHNTRVQTLLTSVKYQQKLFHAKCGG